MHELYIAECILQTARKALSADLEPEEIEDLYVRAGRLDAVVPESLMFLFDAIKASHRMPHASLHIDEVEVRCCCERCQSEFTLDAPVFICPSCGSGDVRVLSGRGIFLERMTIHERASHEHTSCA
jgi:hydrogenase nickel incorporation protein HypA/HybF